MYCLKGVNLVTLGVKSRIKCTSLYILVVLGRYYFETLLRIPQIDMHKKVDFHVYPYHCMPSYVERK